MGSDTSGTSGSSGDSEIIGFDWSYQSLIRKGYFVKGEIRKMDHNKICIMFCNLITNPEAKPLGWLDVLVPRLDRQPIGLLLQS